jgi:hypothetical protein
MVAQRLLARRRQRDVLAALVGAAPAPRHPALMLQVLQHPGQRLSLHPLDRGQLTDRQRTAVLEMGQQRGGQTGQRLSASRLLRPQPGGQSRNAPPELLGGVQILVTHIHETKLKLGYSRREAS